ncbi:MAG: helix-turn-helix domain-containing protein [Thermoproteota archaeon]
MVLVAGMGEKEEEVESLEQEVFKALDHQKRRDILRFIGERKDSAFTEILNASKVSDSPTLSYHLRILAPFIEQRDGKYHLTPIGRDAYNLLLRTAAYDKFALFHKNKYKVTFGNTTIWVVAILVGAFLKVDSMFLIILSCLAGISSSMIYELFE